VRTRPHLTAVRRSIGIAIVLVAVVVGWLLLPNRVFYRAGRPTRLGRLANRGGAIYSGLGLPPSWWVTVETRGRVTGRTVSTTLVVGSHAGDVYLVAMLGESSGWVRNARADGGRAVIHHGRRRAVHLEEVPVAARARILRPYLRRARGARPHFPIPPGAPLADFERIAADYPVFRVTPAHADDPPQRRPTAP